MHDDVAAIVAVLSNKQQHILAGMTNEWAVQRRGVGGFGSLSLDPLQEAGLIDAEYRDEPSSEQRTRYARLTPLGLRVKSALIARGVGE